MTDSLIVFGHYLLMAAPSPYVVSVDLLKGDVILTFDDGKTALFPAELLYATLLGMEEVYEEFPGEQWPKGIKCRS